MKRKPILHPRVFSKSTDAQEYARRHKKMGKLLGKRSVSTLSRMGFREGRILDVGTGPGVVPIEILRAFPQSEGVGLDLSEPLLEIASTNAEEAGVSSRLTFKKGDAQSVPFEDDTFDVIVSFNTLHLVDDPVAMLNEIERVLRPEGMLYVGDIRRSWFGYFMSILKTTFTLEECRELVSQSSLRPCVFEKSILWLYILAGGSQSG